MTDAQSGKPLARAHVWVEEGASGTTTGEAGWYAFRELEPGRHTITISHVGYRARTLPLDLDSGENRRIDVELFPSPFEMDDVTVQGQARHRERHTNRLRPADLERLPSSFGRDVFRSLSFLPGVTTTSDYSSQLHVRGGDPAQTLVQLDGTTVYKPTHFLGFFSMFNPDIIDTVELHKGPYPVEYGGRLGSVVDVRSRPGNRRRTTGGGALSLLASRGYVEGPLDFNGATVGSYRVAARRSTFEPVLSALQTVDTEGIPRDVTFYDVHARLDLRPRPEDRLSLVLYGTHDVLDLHMHDSRIQFDLGHENQGLTATWNHLFSSDLLASVSLLGSRYRTDPVVVSGDQRYREENEISEAGLDVTVRYTGLEAHTVKGGAEASALRFVLRNDDSSQGRRSVMQITETTGGENPGRSPRRRRDGGWDRQRTGGTVTTYVQDTYRPTRQWWVRGGLRGTYYQQGAYWRLSPQVSVAYRPTRSVRLQVAYSRNHQFRTVDRDTRLPGFDTWLVADEDVPPADAHQVSTGTTVQLGERWRLDVSGYYRLMNGLFELKPWLSSSRLARFSYAERFRMGDGRAYGGELYLQRREGFVTGSISYTLGRTERRFPRPFPSADQGYRVAGHDRTHDLNVAAQWHLAKTWTLTSQFSYKTGRPYTPGAEDPLLDHPFPSRDEDRPRQVYTDRLPAYHRMDVGVEKTGRTDWFEYKLSLNVANVYARENVWLHNFVQKNGVRVRDDVPQMPVPVPYITASFQF